MSFSRKIIVIDCGASRTALGIFSQRRGRLRLDRHVVENFPVPAGPGGEWLERTRAALPKLRERAGRGGSCVLVLPGHAVLTKFLKVPQVKPDQRGRIIRFESEQNLPIALSELVWDSLVAGEHEAGLEVMLAASHLKKVEPLCTAARAAGFEPRVVLPASLATLAAFRAVHDQPARPSVVMNIGAYSTTFLLLEAGRFAVRTLALGVTGPEAGDSVRDATGVAHRLAQELRRSVLFFRRQHPLADPEQVYLTGGGARLAGLREALTERTKLAVTDLEFPRALEMDAGIADEVAHSPVLTDLGGAALTQTREGQSVLNLLPPLWRRQADRRRRQIMVAAALLLGALPASAIWSFRTSAQVHHPMAYRPVAANAVQVEVVQPLPAELTEPAPSLVVDEGPIEPALGVQLLGVKTEPYRLQLAGYLGGPGDYLAIFTSPGQPGAMMARSGGRLELQGVELTKFEVKKVAVTHEDSWPVYEVAAEATLYDERDDDEVVLDSRTRKFMRPEATLRLAGVGRESQAVREGDDFQDGDTVYRVERIHLDPPEVVITRRAPEMAEPEVHVLRVAANGETGMAGSAPGGLPAGLASTAR